MLTYACLECSSHCAQFDVAKTQEENHCSDYCAFTRMHQLSRLRAIHTRLSVDQRETHRHTLSAFCARPPHLHGACTHRQPHLTHLLIRLTAKEVKDACCACGGGTSSNRDQIVGEAACQLFWLILSIILVDIVFVISRLNAKQSHEPIRGIG